MAGFISPLRVENIDAKNWEIISRFGWQGSKGDTFWVEVGDTTDFASVPWWSQIILPRTGTWTKAAVLHDKMCDELNAYLRSEGVYASLLTNGGLPIGILEPSKPLFNSVDTDAVFRKNARELGTDLVRSELLWFGVRCGALKNPARRKGWLSTFPRWCADMVGVLGVISAVVFAIHEVIS